MDEEATFINDEELELYFKKEFILIVNESERGAVLLGLAFIEDSLKANLEKMIPKDYINDKDCKGKLKADEFSIDNNLKKSLLLRIIPLHLYKSIMKIKDIRNKLAHKINDFKLKDSIKEIRECGNLISSNQTLSYKINYTAYKLVYIDLIEGIMNLSQKSDLKKINSYNDVVDYLEKNEDLLNRKIDNGLYKTEFAILIFYLVSLLNFHFEKALELLGDNSTLATLNQN